MEKKVEHKIPRSLYNSISILGIYIMVEHKSGVEDIVWEKEWLMSNAH